MTRWTEIEHGYASQEQLRQLLRDGDEAVVHAAVLQIDHRLRAGDALEEWPALLPDDVFGMPAESQQVLAALAVEGYALRAPDTCPIGAALPPFVRVAWLRAAILDRPETLRDLEGEPIAWDAVVGLPCERVIAGGLLDVLIASADANARAPPPSSTCARG
jgi:hypothetical protein